MSPAHSTPAQQAAWRDRTGRVSRTLVDLAALGELLAAVPDAERERLTRVVGPDTARRALRARERRSQGPDDTPDRPGMCDGPTSCAA